MVRIRKRRDHLRTDKKTKKSIEVRGGHYIDLSEGIMKALNASEHDELSVTKAKNDFGDTEIRLSLLE